jgi:predicted TIM-barrel fold metal-dependent hydrolase
MLSRRHLIGGTLAASAGVAICSKPWAQSQRRLIVDSQVHVWKAESPDAPWVPGLKPQISEPMTTERLLALMDEAAVDRVVAIPPSWPGDANDYALDAVRRYPSRFGVMGRIPLQIPQSSARMSKWRDQPGMLGIRLLFAANTASWLKDGTADWFWPLAEEARLPVMTFAPGQISNLSNVAEHHPNLTLILDHMGLGVGSPNDVILSTIKEIVTLARYPNVSVKLSDTIGLSTEPYPFRDISGYIQRVFDAFGPRRCYWGTDMTNSLSKATYVQRITHFTEQLSFLSESDKDLIMGRAILETLHWT